MCKITHCVELHSVCKSAHFRICVNYTLFCCCCKTAHFVQYQSSFFHVYIQKFYTYLISFTQLAVVMVVTNMRCVSFFLFLVSCFFFISYFLVLISNWKAFLISISSYFFLKNEKLEEEKRRIKRHLKRRGEWAKAFHGL